MHAIHCDRTLNLDDDDIVSLAMWEISASFCKLFLPNAPLDGEKKRKDEQGRGVSDYKSNFLCDKTEFNGDKRVSTWDFFSEDLKFHDSQIHPVMKKLHQEL